MILVRLKNFVDSKHLTLHSTNIFSNQELSSKDPLRAQTYKVLITVVKFQSMVSMNNILIIILNNVFRILGYVPSHLDA
jgi:hypothetical protein